MRALICRRWGKVDELSLGETSVPEPGADEVLIRVAATAVNYADSIMVAGRYQTKPDLPFSPGLETAGIVAACGARVTRLKPGDRVMAILAYGGVRREGGGPGGAALAAPAARGLRAARRAPGPAHLQPRTA